MVVHKRILVEDKILGWDQRYNNSVMSHPRNLSQPVPEMMLQIVRIVLTIVGFVWFALNFGHYSFFFWCVLAFDDFDEQVEDFSLPILDRNWPLCLRNVRTLLFLLEAIYSRRHEPNRKL